MGRWRQAAVLLAVVGPANAADLSLQRIMLSSGGVGYFDMRPRSMATRH